MSLLQRIRAFALGLFLASALVIALGASLLLLQYSIRQATL